MRGGESFRVNRTRAAIRQRMVGRVKGNKTRLKEEKTESIEKDPKGGKRGVDGGEQEGRAGSGRRTDTIRESSE